VSDPLPPPGDRPQDSRPGLPPRAPGQAVPAYGYGYAPSGGQAAGWGSRVSAYLIDSLLPLGPMLAGYLVALGVSGGAENLSTAGGVCVAAGYLGGLALWISNRVVRQGRTGQSIGKRALGLRLVAESSGQAVGIGRALGRELMAGIFNNLCFLNLLWPLWDAKRQTWHDKLAGTLVITAER
jgi:uncharacterized RDD family membrane protein YckC